MKYCFILGNFPALSVAELLAVFPEIKAGDYLFIVPNVFFINLAEKIDAKVLIKKLGGTIKIISILEELAINEKNKILPSMQKMIEIREIKNKFKFGISAYGLQNFPLKIFGMEIKKYLKNNNISCRWVTSRETTLSSVVVEQNKLAADGMEFIIISDKDKILIGRTLAVQPFKELSFRDYGRPARDDRSGMLPPKLAQIMINLAAKSRHNLALLDPFCGSGTILTEAVLMGFDNITGADISVKAVEDTKKNMEWMIKNYELKIQNYKLINIKAENLSKAVNFNSADAIITEPYLGPQRGKIDFKNTKKELEELYSKSLKEFYKVIKSGGRVVMVWPVFQFQDTGLLNIEIDQSEYKLISLIPENLKKYRPIKLTDRNTIIYGREGQKVWREIIVLEKL